MAASAGIGYGDFCQMGPAELQACINGYQRRADFEAWRYGMYCYNALCCALQNAFRKKNDPPANYPTEPYSILLKQEVQQEKGQSEEAERLKARLYMHQMMWAGRNLGNKK